MTIRPDQHRPFGATGLSVPPIVFGAAALGDARRVIPDQNKLAICGEWFRHVAPPVLIDVGLNDEADDRTLRMLGHALGRLDVSPDEVVVNIRLGSRDPTDLESLSRDRALVGWEKCCHLLGGSFQPKLAAIQDPDKFLAAAGSAADRSARLQNILGAVRALAELKAAGRISGVGIAVGDFRVVEEIDAAAPLDFVMLSGITVLRHPPELIDFMTGLANRQVAIIAWNVFQCGFLLGGKIPSVPFPADREVSESHLLAWRKSFAALCQGHGVSPAHACIQFALSAPGVVAVTVNSSHADRVAENVNAALNKAPNALWESLAEEGLISYRTVVG